MRPLEIVIPVLIAAHLLWRRPHPFWIRLLPAFALIVTIVHLMIEGYRWQMIPIYVLTGMLVLASVLNVGVKPMGALLILFLLAISTALPILLPIPSIPASNGTYEVGTRIYELTDLSRQELYSGKAETRRFPDPGLVSI